MVLIVSAQSAGSAMGDWSVQGSVTACRVLPGLSVHARHVTALTGGQA